MSKTKNESTTVLATASGSVVAMLGALAAVIATGSTSPVWYGVLIGLGLIALIMLGVAIGNSKKHRNV
jgi:hypothetical protein